MLVVLLAALLSASPEVAPDHVNARFPKGLAPMELGAPPRGLPDWSATRCERCHSREAQAWSLSAHAHARDNFVFQAALTRDDPRWCLGCHAPLARDPQPGPIPEGATDEERGITCAACHASPAGVVSSRAGPSPHALDVVPHAGGSALCAQCHEFGFPQHGTTGEIVGLSGEPGQQDTFAEWQRWQAATGDARGCLDCHGQGDHAFGGVHRIEALAAAITVTEEPGELVLTTRGAGHGLPTGDVMRWLTVEVASDPLFESPLVVARLGRELAIGKEPGLPPRRTITADSRLEPGAPRRVPLPAVDPSGRVLTVWRLVYHLVSLNQEAEGMLDPASTRVVLRTGYLTAPKEAQ